jgi:hypothetical protein
MRKYIFILLMFFFGCSNDPIDKLIPEASLKGSILNISIFDMETQRGKLVQGGLLINASAKVPYDIKQEEVKPTLLASIRELKKQNKDCEWIIVFLCPDGRKGVYAGRGEYREGKISIDYGVPSAKQLAEAEALKIKLADPSLKGKKDEFGIEEYDPNYDPPKLMSKKDFDQASDANDLYYKYYHILGQEDLKKARNGTKWNQDVYNNLQNTIDDRIYRMISEEMSLPEDQIRKLRSKLAKYFAIYAWGEETIQ